MVGGLLEVGSPQLDRLLARLEMRGDTTAHEDAERIVREIVKDVARRGDQALIEHTLRLDGVDLSSCGIEVSGRELDAALAAIDPALLAALERAARRIDEFARHTLPGPTGPLVAGGRVLEQVVRPVERAGLYAPGGRASYPSTVLMGAVPARAAGVGQIVLTTPPGALGSMSAPVLAACRIAAVDRVFRVGGAQAIAALAYGTATIPRADLVAGPGNLYVTLAKRLLCGVVGIDMLAGPTEVVVVAAGDWDPDQAASDLVAQAEHDPLASALLLTPDRERAERALEALARRLAEHPRPETAAESLKRHGAVVVGPLDELVGLVERLAPEHVELLGDAARLADRITRAGAVFVGDHAPEVVGDYLAGPSHVLPTSGTARFASGLSAHTFLRRHSRIRFDAAALAEDVEDIARLARAEGLEGHARSALSRIPSASTRGNDARQP